jgi:Arc/MetJ family transcription regulator
MAMRTNIVLDEELVQEALALSRLKTKRALVEQALREFVAFRKRLDLRELKGTGGMREDYDHKRLRADEP